MGLIIPFFIQHQGCPHRCLFCNQFAISGAGPRPSVSADPVGELKDTIERWLSRSRAQSPTQVAFFGGSFTCLDEALQDDLLRGVAPFIRRGLVDSIRVSTRPECLNPDICDFLISHGVSTVELGAQSMADRVLEQSKRGHLAADTVQAARLLAEHRIETGIQLMVGLPGETTRSFLEGVEMVISLSPGFVRLYPTLVLEHTELANLYRRSSWRPLSLARAVILTGRARTRFLRRGITVIRMGLQHSTELADQLIAGPHHPAFGELVITRNWSLRVGRLLREAGTGKTLHLTISERDYSALAGMHKCNIRRLENLASGACLEVRTEKFLERNTFHYAVN